MNKNGLFVKGVVLSAAVIIGGAVSLAYADSSLPVFSFSPTVPGFSSAAIADTAISSSTEVIQTVNAWQNGVVLPSSTGQAVSYATCEQVIQNNLALAPRFGYTVNATAGTFTDPSSGITIQQGCTPAAPFYIPTPVTEASGGAAPTLATVPCPPQGPNTDVWYIIGQSNASNAGEGRYTASTTAAFAYAGNGQCYQASDPLPGTDGTGAGPWTRTADLMLGQLMLNGNIIKNIVIIDRAIGGSSITQWMQGGIFNPSITSALQDAMANGYTPTRIIWVQGEADTNGMTASTYWNDYISLLTTIRQLGIVAPSWIAQTTICNLRTASDPNDTQVINRTPDSYIFIEKGRLNIRTGQDGLMSANQNFHAGANLDSLNIALRYDGCHLGSYGLTQEAQLWQQALLH